MKAFKGFTSDLMSRLGNGDKEKCTFQPGITMTEESSKTGRGGYHCCENPFDCLTYYALDRKNRFFKVEAAGSIDEDEQGRIACTKITLLEELNPLGLALEGMIYMIEHPGREKWQQNHLNVTVAADVAEAKETGQIAIARGEDPQVKGPVGSILGILKEEDGVGIVESKLFIVNSGQADRWLTIGAGRKLEEVPDEETID